MQQSIKCTDHLHTYDTCVQYNIEQTNHALLRTYHRPIFTAFDRNESKNLSKLRQIQTLRSSAPTLYKPLTVCRIQEPVTAEIGRVVPHKPKTRLPRLHFCHWHYGSTSFSKFDAVGSKSCRIVWNNTKWRSLGRSRSLKVTYVGTDRKPLYNFLLVNNTNLYTITIWHCFWVIVACISLCISCIYLTFSFRRIAELWTVKFGQKN